MKYQWIKLMIASISGIMLAWAAHAEMRGAKSMDDSIKKSERTTQTTNDTWSEDQDENSTWDSGTEMGQGMDREPNNQDFGRNYTSGSTILRGMGMPATALEPKEPHSLRQILDNNESRSRY